VTNPDVDDYIARSRLWPDEMRALRPILLGCGLGEEIKWAKPCYCDDGANIAIVQEMKQFLALMFFKGALLHDPDGVLREQGPNSRSARRLEFRSVGDVERSAGTIRSFVELAVTVERNGGDVGPPPDLVLVAELADRLDRDLQLRTAFDALTPGRRREYHLYVAGAKQAATRESRVEVIVPKILAGVGLRDR
jgi:uncharacterized protein YdeI (YjbR/CyaY-like superfamily)